MYATRGYFGAYFAPLWKVTYTVVPLPVVPLKSLLSGSTAFAAQVTPPAFSAQIDLTSLQYDVAPEVLE